MKKMKVFLVCSLLVCALGTVSACSMEDGRKDKNKGTASENRNTAEDEKDQKNDPADTKETEPKITLIPEENGTNGSSGDKDTDHADGRANNKAMDNDRKGSAADDLGDGVEDLADGAGDAVKNVGKGVSKGVKDVGDSVGDAVEDAGDAVDDMVNGK